jgi:hypothetical protein
MTEPKPFDHTQHSQDVEAWRLEWLRRLRLARDTAKDLAATLEAELASACRGATTMAENRADRARDVLEAISHLEAVWEGYFLCRWPGPNE